MTTKVKRRLTTILCADVKSYARLMESDEARTIGMLRQSRAAMDALVARHDGRTVNTWGDAVIAEFASVVEAVQCGIEIQRELGQHNQERPEAEQMWFRIGINLGDVMVENDDLYGEGVNIAARLQELAEPGGILISSTVYDLVRNKLTVGFDFLGQQAIKNVTEPVSCYRVMLDGDIVRPQPAAAGPAAAPALERASGPARRILANVPRSVKAAAAIILFLFAINLFTGFDPIWFHWPASAIALLVALRLSLARKGERS
ncbi:MAG TPA: adenylate/guanylate cyclase domain-containing protein [Dongiaceae bacterium]|nr:adenylate/guanylate cyclase domain-containing protein [Dongiaceae bacterium]